jgi:hypothetical protein
MSIIDFITGLFRDPASLRAYLENPVKALRDAGFPDATPEDVEALLPTLAADDPSEALRHLDVEELCVPPVADKSIGAAETEDDHVIIDATKAVVGDKGIGPIADDPLTPEIEGDVDEPVQEVDAPYADHALDTDLLDPELSSTVWAETIE